MKKLLFFLLLFISLHASAQRYIFTTQARFYAIQSASDTAETVANNGRLWFDFATQEFRGIKDATRGSIGGGVQTITLTGDVTGSGTGSFATSISGKYVIDQASPSTAGGTITLDMNSQIQRSFVGSASFSGVKTIAMSNTTNSMFFNFIFEVTNVAAVITVPADWLMSSDDFDGADWTPPEIGKYELGGSYDDVNNVWYVKINSDSFH